MEFKEFQREKIIVSCMCFIISISAAGVYYTETIFPSLPLGFILAIGIILVFWRSTWRQYYFSLSVVIGLSVLYRVFIVVYPASLIGLDPDRYAMSIHSIAQTGTTDALTIYFYSNASAFPVLGAMFDVISGVNSAKAMVIFPVAIGIVFPSSVAAIAQRLAKNKQASLYAAIIAAFGSISIWLSYWPIPQTIGAVLWVILFVSLLLYEKTRRKELFIVAEVILIAQLYTHKMPLVIITISFFAYSLIHLIDSVVIRETNILNQRWIILGALSVAVIILQWSFLTNYIIPVSYKFAELFSTKSLTLQSPIAHSPSHAISAYNGLSGIIVRRLHAFVLIPLAGIGWLYLLTKNTRNRAAWIVLAASSAAVFFVALGVINPLATSPVRALLMAEPFLAILVSILATRAYNTSRHRWLYIGKVVFVVILVSQLSVVYAAPDHPINARMYLSSEEVEAKQFGHERINSEIYADSYLADERTPYEIQRGIQRNHTYRPVVGELLNKNVASMDYKYMAYRTNVDIYRLPGGIWRLTWDPEKYLNDASSQIYSNGDVDMYYKKQR